ncbi:hypothetical protein BDN70DRAFT_894566 [Pholiota conissans]|uniref:Uncharacterized protein n=1 Tax=Pholiota conissans TaxID=109636 RepID=A0A9P5Z338_9AGAR|nr:hypothetical protein BDN70DRAFT_894566 [Pholiota conissans]
MHKHKYIRESKETDAKWVEKVDSREHEIRDWVKRKEKETTDREKRIVLSSGVEEDGGSGDVSLDGPRDEGSDGGAGRSDAGDVVCKILSPSPSPTILRLLATRLSASKKRTERDGGRLCSARIESSLLCFSAESAVPGLHPAQGDDNPRPASSNFVVVLVVDDVEICMDLFLISTFSSATYVIAY